MSGLPPPGPPPPYEEHSKYPPTPIHTTTFVNPAFQSGEGPLECGTGLHLPGQAIYGYPGMPQPQGVPIQTSNYDSAHRPVYRHGRTIVTNRQPGLLSPEQQRRRRIILMVSVMLLVCPLIIFLIVMTCTVWTH